MGSEGMGPYKAMINMLVVECMQGCCKGYYDAYIWPIYYLRIFSG